MADTANGNGGEIPEIELIIKVSIAEAKKKRKMCLVQHVECQNVKTTMCIPDQFFFSLHPGELPTPIILLFRDVCGA